MFVVPSVLVRAKALVAAFARTRGYLTVAMAATQGNSSDSTLERGSLSSANECPNQ
ncbi:hypothetical protein BH10PLA2_BH10PLA2_24690 [soil metagenome]